MANGKISKEKFIKAYQWLYAASKKEVEFIWSISTYEYKVNILQCYTDYCKKAILLWLKYCTTYPLAQP